MSHASEADKLLIKPAARARPAPPHTRRQIIPKARNAASHPTSHKQHEDTRLATAPDRPTLRVSQSPEGARLDLVGADEFSVVCQSLARTDP